jgi:hypothetical protein
MAISDDTAAQVAAQLTIAWAARAGAIATPDPERPAESQVASAYLHFKAVVAEAKPPRGPFI